MDLSQVTIEPTYWRTKHTSANPRSACEIILVRLRPDRAESKPMYVHRGSQAAPRSAYNCVLKPFLSPCFFWVLLRVDSFKGEETMSTTPCERPENGEIHTVEDIEEISRIIDLYSSQLWEINQKVQLPGLAKESPNIFLIDSSKSRTRLSGEASPRQHHLDARGLRLQSHQARIWS